MRQERVFAVGLFVLLALAAVLGVWVRVLDNDEAKASTQLTAARIHIEKVTSLRRDTRKAHVALLERWLLPPEKRGDSTPALQKMVATVAEEHDDFRALATTEEAEASIRERLASAHRAWTASMTSTLAENRGPEWLAEHQTALADVDREADGVLKLNSKSGEGVDQRIVALRGLQRRIEQGFLAALLAAVGIGLLWRARRRAEARIFAANQREEARAAKLRAQFFASMSHELRTPLVAITNLAATFDQDSSLDKRKGLVSHIEREAKDLLSMINNILDLAKLESEHVELLIEDIALAEVIERCVSRCRPLIRDRPVELIVELPEEELHVRADFVKLQQVFTNLIANAIKFTEQGSVTIRARSMNDDRVEIEITDTGIGIEAPALDSIWSAFRQADSRISKKFGGTGLGLAIAKGVLDRIDGRVRVDSTVGNGTTFTVSLPSASAPLVVAS